MQPIFTSLIEVTLWLAIFAGSQTLEIGGFSKDYYLSYAIWTAFIGRITASWMYEMRMIEEIDSGSVNGLLVRPMSFYEYYLSQLLGYKFITTVLSLIIPFAVTWFLELPLLIERVPAMLLLVMYYLVLVHTLGFCVATLAFRWNRVHAMTTAKNLGLWLISGELLPLDLIPDPYKTWILNLPFANAVYIPVGYITGRIDTQMLIHGFVTTTWGIVIFSVIGAWMWQNGLKKYVGTGA